MEYKKWMEMVTTGINSTIQGTSEMEAAALAAAISQADRIFLMGRGRTGLVVDMFGMRLAQLGLPVFIVSQPTTPALSENDLLVLASGSGQTDEILGAARLALEIGAHTFALTQDATSPLAGMAKDQLIIPSPPQSNKVLNGTLFEMALLITLDAVVAQLLELSEQNFEQMSARHANLG